VYDVVGEFGGVPVEGVGFDFGCGYEVVGDGADVLFRWGVRGTEEDGVGGFVGPMVSEFKAKRVGVVERWIEGVHWRVLVGVGVSGVFHRDGSIRGLRWQRTFGFGVQGCLRLPEGYRGLGSMSIGCRASRWC